MGTFEEDAGTRSDWTDQDLLTLGEAAQRLAVLEREIVEALEKASADERPVLETRLRAARAILGRDSEPRAAP